MNTQEDNEEWGEITPNNSNSENKNEVEFEIEEPETQEREELTAREEQEDNKEKVEKPTKESSKSEEDPDAKKELAGIETEGAQKRIRRLVAQRKEVEQRAQSLEERVKEYEEKLREREEALEAAQKSSLDSTESSLQEQINLAQANYIKALEEGDAKQIAEAQQKVYRAEINLAKVSDKKREYEELVASKPKKTEQQQQPTQQQQQQYDPLALEWAEKNKDWFGQDPVLTNAALAVDAILKEEGWNPAEEEYYEEVDRRLSQYLPKKEKEAEVVEQEVQKTEPEAPKQPSQVVGGASRTVTNPNTGRSNKVKLTQQDVAMAKKWGIPLERYAEQKRNAELAGDEYTTITTK